jgi:hypothetical protein
MKIDKPLAAAPLLDRLSGTVPEIAQALGVSDRTIQRMRTTGIDPYLADEIAIRHLGMHPWEIWGDEWWLEAADCPPETARTPDEASNVPVGADSEIEPSLNEEEAA